MTAYIYVLTLIPFLGILFYYLYKAKKQIEKRGVFQLVCMLLYSMGYIVTHIVIALSQSAIVSSVAFGMYFILCEWYMFATFRFAYAYTGHELHKMHRLPLFWMLLIENFYILGNLLSNRLFIIVEKQWKGHTYYVAEMMPRQFIHVAIICIMLVGALGILVHKIVSKNTFYRQRYIVIFLLLVLEFIMDAVSGAFETPLNWSIIFYTICTVGIFQYAIHYAPDRVLGKTIQLAVKDMDNGILIYNDESELVYANEYLYEALNISGPEELAMEENFREWMKGCKEQGENTWLKTFVKYNHKTYIKITLRTLCDEQKIIASYYLVQDITSEYKKMEVVDQRANHDLLTGLYNERYFYEKCEETLQKNPYTRYLMICSDIEHFKMINDIFGMEKGDEVLLEIADTLRKHCKEGSVVGRIGSDSFAVLMPRARFEEQIFTEFAKKMMESVGIYSFSLVCYIGVYEVVDKNMAISIMCDKAMLAIGTIKGDYTKRIAWYQENLRDSVFEEKKYSAELERALKEEQIIMYLQPLVNRNDDFVGAEALVRWNHPEEGLLNARQFVHYFEKNGRIAEIDRLMWQKACETLRKWKEMGFEDKFISVNVAEKDLYLLDVYEILMGLVQEYEIDTKNLKLEFKEVSITNDFEYQVELINNLKSAGFQVVMDNFGSEHSSFHVLENISLDALKMDMDSLSSVENRERCQSVIKSIIGLGKELGMQVIAENIESREQKEFLMDTNCDLFQGQFICRPMEPEAMERRFFSSFRRGLRGENA